MNPTGALTVRPSAAVPAPGPLDRLEFETLISDFSARLMAVSLAEVEPAIDAALGRIRAFFQADRCALLSVAADRQVVNVACASHGEGVVQVSGDVNLVELFPWSRHKLLVERVPVIVHRMADLPPEASVDRASWEHPVPTRSSLTTPIYQGTVATHLMVIQWVHEEHHVPGALVPRLRMLGEMLVNALARRQAFEDLWRSQVRLDRAAAAGRCGLWEIDFPTGKIWVTSETRRMYGLTPDEPVTYDHFMRLLHPDDRETVSARIDCVIRGDGIFDQMYRIVRADGAVRWMHGTGRSDDRTLLVGASVDVTDREEAETRARAQAALVAAAAESAELAFSEWHSDTVPRYLDARMRDLFGLAGVDAEQVYEVWNSRLHPDDRATVVEHRQRVLADERAQATLEYRYDHPDRGQIWVRHTLRRLEDEQRGNGGLRLIGAVQDVTQRRQREEELRAALEEVGRLRDRLEQESIHLRRDAIRARRPEQIIGRSPTLRNAVTLAEQVAATTSTVLLLGETGTGKERFAEYIHQASPRSGLPMVRVNCSAIPTALIESELFGREKGAYTGALSKQIGRFELAHGSTLFLDEIGDLPLEIQVKLLRVLQDHAIERLGSPRSIAVDVRIVAATNRNLEEAVRDGTFRADLYYRLNVFPIVVPPLRTRPEDIPALVGTLVEKLSYAMGKRFDAVEKGSMERLVRYPWPGNVRELRNVLERAMILSPGPILTVTPPAAASPAPAGTASEPAGGVLHDVEREHILLVLKKTGWRIRGVNGAAAVLGFKPTTLEARMVKLGIRRPATGAR